MKINIKIILIIFALTFTSCAEKISHSGTLSNLNIDVNNLNNKKELIKNLGYPNFIDPIEKKYFYFSEKKISKNVYDNKIIYRKLLVFSFNSNDTIEAMKKFRKTFKGKITQSRSWSL